MQRVEVGCGEALGALRVEHEPGVHDSGAPLDPRHDLLGAGHLRDAVGMHEADGLHGPKARGREAVHELRAHGRLQHRLLVLEAVARAHVA